MTPAQNQAALCTQVDPELFFPEVERGTSHAAKMICQQCPVRLPCLIGAIERQEEHGIWAGFTRRAIRRLTVETAPLAIAGDKKITMRLPRGEGKGGTVDAELRAAHTAFGKGDRSPEVLEGEREYQASRYQIRKARRRAA
jgi:WhiB family redox-sensing transcriptional regulator